MTPISDVMSLRRYIASSCLRRIPELECYYENHLSQQEQLRFEGLEDYLQRNILTDGEWANDFDMILFYVTFGIQLTSFRPGYREGEYVMFSIPAHITIPSSQILEPNQPIRDETIFIYNHVYLTPLTFSVTPNHFCFLRKSNIIPSTAFPIVFATEEQVTRVGVYYDLA